jgi:hypothetical protein
MDKTAIIKELNELARCGIRRTIHVIDAIREGSLDTEIDGLVGMSVSEAADLLCDLVGR